MNYLLTHDWLIAVQCDNMKAFIPQGATRKRQTVTRHPFPGRGSALPDGAEMRQAPVIYCGALPDGTELRQIPVIHCGSLPDGTELRQCPAIHCG
jgi:hypothetical protein